MSNIATVSVRVEARVRSNHDSISIKGIEMSSPSVGRFFLDFSSAAESHIPDLTDCNVQMVCHGVKVLSHEDGEPMPLPEEALHGAYAECMRLSLPYGAHTLESNTFFRLDKLFMQIGDDAFDHVIISGRMRIVCRNGRNADVSIFDHNPFPHELPAKHVRLRFQYRCNKAVELVSLTLKAPSGKTIVLDSPKKQLGMLARSDCGSFTHRYAHVRGFLNGVPVPVTLADVLLSTVTGVAVCGDDEVKLAFDCMRVKLGDGQYMFAGLALSDDLKVVCN